MEVLNNRISDWHCKAENWLSVSIWVHFISCYPDDRGYSIRNLRYMKHFASAYPDFPILQVPLAELENEGHWVKKEIKRSLKICRFRIIFVPLHSLEPAKPLNDAQMCGSFYFYTFPLLRFSYFQTKMKLTNFVSTDFCKRNC